MKKILYIIPILVFAMVGLTQDAKAQSGQTGNASNAITQAASNTVATNALVATSNNSQGGGTNGGPTVSPNGNVTTSNPVPPSTPSVSVLTTNNQISLRTNSVSSPFSPTNPTNVYQHVQILRSDFSIRNRFGI